jgi:Tfp pilus assembly protein PilF
MITSARQRLLFLLAIVLVPIVVYFNSLRNPFHYDDMHTVVDNPHLKDLTNIPKYFIYPQMFSARSHPRGMYRPVLLTSYALNYRIAGMNPSAFHAVNLAIHVANSLIVFLIFLQLAEGAKTAHRFRDAGARGNNEKKTTRLFAAIAALLFSLHPVQTEALNYISCRSETLASLFYLLGLMSFIKARLGQNKTKAGVIGFLSLSLVFYALSLLTKSIAISFPVMILFFSVLFHLRRKAQGGLRTFFLSQIPFWVMTLVYLVVRKALFGYTLAPIKPRSVLVNLLTQADVIIHYLKLIVIPIGLSVDRDFPVVRSPFDQRFLVSAMILGVIAALVIWLTIKDKRVIAFCIGWFFIALLPTSSVLPLEVVMNEHRLYLSVAGLALAGSFSLMDLKTRIQASGYVEKAVAAFVLILLCAYGGLVISRNKVWSTEIGLWSDALKKSPTCLRAYGKLGNAYRNKGDLKKALEIYQAGMKLDKADPQMPWLIYNVGTLYHELRDYERAVAYYREALHVGGPSPVGYSALAAAYLDMGRYDDAIETYRKALSIAPEPSYSLHYQLGLTYLRAGRKEEGIAEWRKSLMLNPNQPEIIEFFKKERLLSP